MKERNIGLLSTLACYILWGLLPLYWHILEDLDSIFILCNRIIWSAVFTIAILLITKKFGEVVFDAPLATEEDRREAYGEQRLQSLGLFYGVVVFVVWVDRPAAPHLISVRKATRHEEQRYWQTVGH